MSPEGLKLLKRMLMGLVGFIVLLLGYRGYGLLAPEPGQEKSTVITNANETSSGILASLLNEAPTESIRSAKQGLIGRLHFYAYNYYRSNRIKNAIQTWDTVKFLSPNDPVIDLRLKEARTALRQLVEENISLGNVDYLYLRYERAIHFWTRAANLAAGMDASKHAEAEALILMAERHVR